MHTKTSKTMSREDTVCKQIPGTFWMKFDGTRPRLPSINSPSKNPSYTTRIQTRIYTGNRRNISVAVVYIV